MNHESVSSFVAPPVAIAFIMGFFWEKADERAIFASLIVGSIIGSCSVWMWECGCVCEC